MGARVHVDGQNDGPERLLVGAGADVLSVQCTLGHSSSETTLKFYAHVMGANHLRAGMDRLDQANEEAVRTLPRDETRTSNSSPIRLPFH